MELQKVIFDVGGTRYSTFVSTIMKYPESTLAIMIENEEVQGDIECGQALFIDRDGAIFSRILQYYRNGCYMILPTDDVALNELIQEADYFQLPKLKELAEEKAKENEICKVGNWV